MSATRLQKEEAAKIMEFGDPIPACILSTNALRIIKCQNRKSNQIDDDSIISLVKMKANVPYTSIFRDIGYDPFFIHHWSAPQMNAYHLYTRSTSVSRISIDATGGVMRPVNLASRRKTRAIFLYEIVVRNENCNLQFPLHICFLSDMITQRFPSFY